jgi:hypothetical protein
MLFTPLFPPHSSVGAAYDRHQLFDLTPLVRLVARGDRVLNAVTHMVAQDFFFQATQSSTHRSDLRYDVDAVPILLYHPAEASNLTFNALQAFGGGCLDVFPHVP